MLPQPPIFRPGLHLPPLYENTNALSFSPGQKSLWLLSPPCYGSPMYQLDWRWNIWPPSALSQGGTSQRPRLRPQLWRRHWAQFIRKLTIDGCLKPLRSWPQAPTCKVWVIMVEDGYPPPPQCLIGAPAVKMWYPFNARMYNPLVILVTFSLSPTCFPPPLIVCLPVPWHLPYKRELFPSW